MSYVFSRLLISAAEYIEVDDRKHSTGGHHLENRCLSYLLTNQSFMFQRPINLF